MPRFETDPDLRRLGEALAGLRRDQGLSQAEAGARVGMTSQGWGLYEAGKRPSLFRPDVQRRMTTALDCSPEALALRAPSPTLHDEAPASGFENRGRDFHAAASRRLEIRDDSLTPWAGRGVVVEYVEGRPPRPGQGCVIEREDGATQVRVFVSANWRVLTVRGGPGGFERDEAIPLSAVWRVSAVVARLEP